jgi:hypothetical protein
MSYPPLLDIPNVEVQTKDGANYTFQVVHSGDGPHRLVHASVELTEEQAAKEALVNEPTAAMEAKGWFPTFHRENLRFDSALTFQLRTPG